MKIHSSCYMHIAVKRNACITIRQHNSFFLSKNKIYAHDCNSSGLHYQQKISDIIICDIFFQTFNFRTLFTSFKEHFKQSWMWLCWKVLKVNYFAPTKHKFGWNNFLWNWQISCTFIVKVLQIQWHENITNSNKTYLSSSATGSSVVLELLCATLLK